MQWSYADKIPEALEKAGLGQEPIFAVNENLWYAKSGNTWMQHPGGLAGVGLGDLTDSALQTAAQTLQTYLTTNGAVTTSFQECLDFQNAYNSAGGSPQIQTDGEYGPCCQQALQNVWNAAVSGGSGAAQQAPQTGFAGTCSNGTYVAPAAGSNTQNLPTEVVTASPPGTIGAGTAILIGAGVFAAGLVSWALLSKKKPHGGSRRGHSSRRSRHSSLRRSRR
jgi:hypothetical protein